MKKSNIGFSKYYSWIAKGHLDMKMNRLVWSLLSGKRRKIGDGR